jgi:sugar phosphate permease
MRNGPEEHESEGPVSPLHGLRSIFGNRDFRITFVLFVLGLGMFNAISTVIDQVCEQKGLDIEQTGLVGGLMLIAGIVGGVILPILSDAARKRRPFLVGCMLCMLPGVFGLAWSAEYAVLLASSFAMGFFLLGGGAPIGFQYAAEVSHPAPESVTQGVILMGGQLSGILFILAMNGMGMQAGMWMHVAIAAVIVALTTRLRESPLILTGG